MGFSADSTGDKLMVQMQNDIGTNKSPRVIIPIIHLYLDHIMSLLLEKKSAVASELLGDNIRSSFIEKLKILYALNVVNQEEFKELKRINKIRNDFAHSFNPDEDRVKNEAMKLTLHVFNERRSYTEMILYSGIELMSRLDDKFEN